jgi:hypothetical protein
MLSDALSWITIVTLGLFAGSLLTEDRILVPYWRTLSAEAFNGLHATFGPILYRYYAPLTTLAVLLAVANAIVASWGGALNLGACLAAIILLATLGLYFAYFQAANAKFAAHALEGDALSQELTKWAGFHRARTIAVIIAFAAALAAYSA